MTSEPAEPFLGAWLDAREYWLNGEDDKATAYLRERFVTREEYGASVKGERLQMAGKHKEAAEARLWFTKAQEWRAEIEALTAERDRLREAIDAIKWEAKRENGNWLHLKRCIAVQASQALGETQ